MRDGPLAGSVRRAQEGAMPRRIRRAARPAFRADCLVRYWGLLGRDITEGGGGGTSDVLGGKDNQVGGGRGVLFRGRGGLRGVVVVPGGVLRRGGGSPPRPHRDGD